MAMTDHVLPYFEAVAFIRKHARKRQLYLWVEQQAPRVHGPHGPHDETVPVRNHVIVTLPALMRFLQDTYCGKTHTPVAVRIGITDGCLFIG